MYFYSKDKQVQENISLKRYDYSVNDGPETKPGTRTNQIEFWTSDIPKFDHKLEINFTILVLYMCYQDVCYK